MKYNSNYESVQNCSSGAELLQILDENCSNFAIPVSMSLSNAGQFCNDEFTNSFQASNNCENENLKCIKRKTCTCASGIVPCPFHGNTDRTSCNGYNNNNNNNNSSTNLQCTKTNIVVPGSRSKKITFKDEVSDQNLIQYCKTNGKISKKITSSKQYKGILSTHHKYSPTDEKIENTLSNSGTYTKLEGAFLNHLNNGVVALESTSSSNDSLIVVNQRQSGRNEEPNLDELKLSLSSLISKDTVIAEDKQASEAFQKWLVDKKRQEREIREKELNLQQLLEQEKQRKLEMEQENFLNWLHTKKQKEKQEKELKKKALEEEQRKKYEKLKREELNKKQYQLWLKLKEEQVLVKKINEQKRKIEKEERDKQRLERNKNAFEKWLISSKDKPKPVPLNQGLDSLRTSTSVSFINPTPWVPNIVENQSK